MDCQELHLYDVRYGEASPERLLDKIEEINPDRIIYTNYSGNYKMYELMSK